MLSDRTMHAFLVEVLDRPARHSKSFSHDSLFNDAGHCKTVRNDLVFVVFHGFFLIGQRKLLIGSARRSYKMSDFIAVPQKPGP